MSAIGLIILAAGGSTRLGSPKQLLLYESSTLLRRAAETALVSSCRPIVVVLGASATQCAEELAGLPVSSAVNTEWNEGLSSSIRTGMEALEKASAVRLNAVILMLCDQPLLTAGTLEALAAEHLASKARIVACEYGKAVGVPVLFDRSIFPELLSLTGSQGAKPILQRYSDQICKIAFADGAIDIDTAADYARLSRP